MFATINILNVTGTQLIGVHWAQNTATSGNLTAETGCYMNVIRVS